MKGILLISFLYLISFSLQIDYLSRRELVEDYSIYVFCLQWGNNKCKYNSKGHVTDCQLKLKEMPINSLSIHGLWPNKDIKTQTGSCFVGEDIPIVPDDTSIFKRMKHHWTNLEFNKTNEWFWGHEYSKHGFCYSAHVENYDYKVYFEKALELYDKYDFQHVLYEILGKPKAGTYTYSYDKLTEKLDEKFRTESGERAYSLDCYDSPNALKELNIYLDMNFNLIKSNEGNKCKKKDNSPIIIEIQ